MEPTHLQILRARRAVLSEKPKIYNWIQNGNAEDPCDDPFSVEAYGQFLPSPQVVQIASTTNDIEKKSKDIASNVRAVASSASKVTKRRGRRFVSNWTPEKDEVIRQSLIKYGWGAWTRIANSGKLPKEYTPKMISNRANSIGLTKETFAATAGQLKTSQTGS